MSTSSRSYRWLFWFLAVGGLTLDLGSKYFLFSHFYNGGAGGQVEVIPGAFRLYVHPFEANLDESEGWLRTLRASERRPYVNRGALFGIGQGKNLIFGIVSVTAAAFIIGWSFREASAQDGFLCLALGLILAGTLGNLYDRVVFDGVRDFFHWYRWFDWPVFNVADVCLVLGAGLLLLEAVIRKPDAEPTPPAPLKDSVPLTNK